MNAAAAWIRRHIGEVSAREAALLAGFVLLGFAIRLTYVLLTKDHRLLGDELEYDIEGRFIEAGKWFWSTTPYGNPHPSIWKVPGYPVFVGIGYKLLGVDPGRVLLLQTLLGPITILLTWVLARRLFGPPVALASAAIVAVYPFAWLFDGRLLSEVLATPPTLLALILLLDRPPSWRRAIGIGALLGVLLLIRPTSSYVLAAALVAWIVMCGLRRGVALTLACGLVACAVVAPWTIRNASVTDGYFVPLSSQDQALYGVFNDDAAHDPVYPWAWRYKTRRDRDLFLGTRRLSDAKLREELQRRAFDYIKAHPDSVPKAFFWNGITRLWDIRRPAHVLGEASATGRPRTLAKIGLAMYWVMLPLALAGLWLGRRRPQVVLPLVAIALTASVLYTSDAATRYRAPLEPVIVILATFAVHQLWTSRRQTT